METLNHRAQLFPEGLCSTASSISVYATPMQVPTNAVHSLNLTEAETGIVVPASLSELKQLKVTPVSFGGPACLSQELSPPVRGVLRLIASVLLSSPCACRQEVYNPKHPHRPQHRCKQTMSAQRKTRGRGVQQRRALLLPQEQMANRASSRARGRAIKQGRMELQALQQHMPTAKNFYKGY
jgi:hypothetical protein